MATGMITDRQNTNTTSKVITIFSVRINSLRMTTDKAVRKKGQVFEVNHRNNCAKSESLWRGDLVHRWKKNVVLLDSPKSVCAPLRNASQRSKAPKAINEMEKNKPGSLGLLSVVLYPNTTTETPIRLYALMYPNA